MKKIKIVSLALFTAGGLFLLGWHLGQKSATKLASDLMQRLMFGHAYSQIAINEVAIEQIDAGHIEAARNTIYLNTDGNIFALNNVLDSTNAYISLVSMKMLLEMDQDTQTQYGSPRETSNKLLARVAKYRAEHPRKDSGGSPTTSDPEIEAKLTAILKKAGESQK